MRGRGRRARFAPPADSRIGQDLGESLRQTFSGPGWQAAKTAAGLAAGGLGAFIRFAPYFPGQQTPAEDDLQAAMPPAEPAVLETEGGPPPPDDLLYLLYRSGENPAFTATLHQWHDLNAMTARVPESARDAGHGGVGYLINSLNAVTHGKPVARTVARLRVGGRDKYRVDYPSRPGRNNPKTIACDGEHRWQVYAAQTMVGPAHPPPDEIANLVDSSWLLGYRLSGGAEISYHGRRAYHVSVARGGGGLQVSTLLFFPAEVIVDAELGCLLRLISFAGERPASWWELSGVRPGMPYFRSNRVASRARSGGRPNFSRARWNSCEYAANRAGGPPMMASMSENPRRAARIAALLDDDERGFQERVLAGPPPLGPGAPPLDRLIAYGRARTGFMIRHREIARAALDGRQRVPAGSQTPMSREHIRFLLGEMNLDAADLDILATQLTAALDGPLRSTCPPPS